VSFRVDPPALRAAAVLYATHADHLDVTDRYHDQYSEIDWSRVGLIDLLNASHHEFVRTLSKRLRQAADLLRDSALALHKAAEAYDHSDMKSAAAFDAALASPWPAVPDATARP
jgi:hypothetical protein